MDLINAELARLEGDVDGAGITIAVFDCGCRASHATFSSADALPSRVLEGQNFTGVGDNTDASDAKGHGTAVAAIIAGNLNSSGVAPKARILPLKTTINPADGEFSSVLEALTWLLTEGKEFDVSVVNLSLGDSGNYRSTNEALAAGGPARQQIVDKIRELRNLRIPTVAAVGNGFFSPDQSKLGMCFPAIMPECISVGAVFVDNSYFEERFLDCGSAFVRQSFSARITPFSQRLPKSGTDPHFTRLFAPGAPVESAAITSNFDLVKRLHGASVAAPFVTGVIALLQEKFKALRGGQLPPCDDLERWLLKGAKPIFDKDEGNDEVQHDGSTYNLLDASGALNAMLGEFLIV